MKMQRINQCLLVALCMIFAACENMMDVHQEYIRDGEIIYAPKVYSPVFLSGKERVLFRGVLGNAPNVKTVDIFWNSGKDSMIVAVSPTEGIYPVEAVLPMREEKAYTFDVRTTDVHGRHSLKVSGFATSYGSLYESSLVNRNVQQMIVIAGQGGEISWLSAPENLVRCEVRYTDASNATRVVHALPSENATVCPNPKEGTTFEYRSLYLPEATAVDTFAVAWMPLTPDFVRYNRSAWSVISCSDEDPNDGGGKGSLIDGILTNWWHSQWSPMAPSPHWAIIDMASSHDIARIDTYRRPGNTNTKTVTYYVGDDPDPAATTWVQIASGEYSSGDLLRLDVPADKFAVAKGRYLKIFLPDSNAGSNTYTSVAEVYVFGKN